MRSMSDSIANLRRHITPCRKRSGKRKFIRDWLQWWWGWRGLLKHVNYEDGYNGVGALILFCPRPVTVS